MKYRTRIADHLRAASIAELERGRKVITWQQVSNATDVAYRTVLRYANETIPNPNYAVVDVIRQYLNGFAEMSSEGYILRAGNHEDASEGQAAGALAR